MKPTSTDNGIIEGQSSNNKERNRNVDAYKSQTRKQVESQRNRMLAITVLRRIWAVGPRFKPHQRESITFLALKLEPTSKSVVAIVQEVLDM